MEYVPGGDMMTWLIKLDTFPEKTAQHYIAETILAINSIHELGYLHRDVKPDNLLFDATGHIKLTDFGLSAGINNSRLTNLYNLLKDADKELKVKEKVSKTVIDSWKKKRKIMAYSTVGTPDYIAPEGARWRFVFVFCALLIRVRYASVSAARLRQGGGLVERRRHLV